MLLIFSFSSKRYNVQFPILSAWEGVWREQTCNLFDTRHQTHFFTLNMKNLEQEIVEGSHYPHSSTTHCIDPSLPEAIKIKKINVYNILEKIYCAHWNVAWNWVS